jgi:hypothetical protein
MTQYRTYLDDTTEVGKETISGIQQNGSQFGIGISTDLQCNNINCGIITSIQGFISIGNTTPIQILLTGNQLTFNAVGIGSTTVILS